MLLTVAMLHQLTGISKNSLYDWCYHGRLNAVRDGKKWMVDISFDATTLKEKLMYSLYLSQEETKNNKKLLVQVAQIESKNLFLMKKMNLGDEK